jgi:hypothetical protein
LMHDNLLPLPGNGNSFALGGIILFSHSGESTAM